MKRKTETLRVRSFAWAAGGLALVLLLFAGCPTTDSLYGQAYLKFLERDEAQALKLLSAIIEKDARYVPAYILEAAIFETRGDWNRTEAILLQAKKTASASPVVCFNLGNIYFKKGEFAKAVDEYTRALELNPGFNEAYINRANARLKLGDLPAALKDYETFLSNTKGDYPNVRALVNLLRQDLALAPATR
jgi:tetratricopeptide (TPR) repeat protein